MKGRSPRPALPVETRERILGVTLEMVRSRGNAAFSLVEIAEQAQVSRQTLYLLFGSRAGLLLALVDHLDATHPGPARLAQTRQAGQAAQGDFEPYVRAWFGYLPAVLPVARALAAAAAAGDEDAHQAWQSRLAMLRQGFAHLATALHAAGRLRPGWTRESAADWMLALTHIDLWQRLVVESGWQPATHVDRILATLRESLLVEP